MLVERFDIFIAFSKRIMDNSRSSTSSSSQHYSSLLATVSELRNDLEKTMNKIYTLEQQNQTLTNNYHTVKEELVDTRKKYNETRESYMQTVTEKFEAEKKYEGLINRIQAQLAEKTKEFEIVRDKLVPHDVDQLRIKIQEELEVEHKAQLQAIEHELEVQRDQCFAVKRELGRSQAENEIIVQHLQHEIVSIRAERESVESSLRSEILKLKDIEFHANAGKTDFVRTHKSKALELQNLLDLAREDSKNLRAEREDLIFELEKTRSANEIAQAELRVQLAVAEGNARGLEEKLARISIDNDRKDAAVATLRNTAEDLQQRVDVLTRQLQHTEKLNNTLREDHQKQIEMLGNIHAEEKQELIESLEASQARLLEREEIVRRAQRDASVMQTRAESVEVELRRNHLMQMQELRKHNASLEVQVADAQQALKAKELQCDEALEQLRFENNGLVSELCRIKREKDIHLAKLHELQVSIEAERGKHTVLSQESATKISHLEQKERELMSEVRVLESKLSDANAKYYEAQNLVQMAKEKANGLEHKTIEQVALMEAMKREFQVQLEMLNEKYEGMKYKMGASQAKEKKRADAYKTKALEAHMRVKALTSSAMDSYHPAL